MTGGVKQALPQMLVPNPGVEAKSARIRMPRIDFSVTLGLAKPSTQPKSDHAKALQQDSGGRPAWPRMPPALDPVAGDAGETQRMREAPPSPGEISLQSDDLDGMQEVLDDTVDDEKQSREGPVAVTVHPARTIPSRFADAPPASVGTAVPVPAPAARAQSPGLPVRQPTVDQPPADELPASELAAADGKPVETKGVEAGRVDRPNPAAGMAVREPVLADADDEIDPADRPALQPSGRKGEKSDTPLFTPIGRGERAEPARFEPAARSAAATQRSATSQTSAEAAIPDTPPKPEKTAPRVTVLAQQAVPAPMSSTALVLVESIAASKLLDTPAPRLAFDAIHASATHASVQSLKIQLHPAELGMVTATLRFVGDQLSIELQVENKEAHRRLSSDSETIVGALRDLGYDIDKVTVLQPAIASTSAGRSDAHTSMPSPQARSGEQFGSGTANDGGNGSRENPPGTQGNSGNDNQRNPSAHKEGSGSDLYI